MTTAKKVWLGIGIIVAVIIVFAGGYRWGHHSAPAQKPAKQVTVPTTPLQNHAVTQQPAPVQKPDTSVLPKSFPVNIDDQGDDDTYINFQAKVNPGRKLAVSIATDDVGGTEIIGKGKAHPATSKKRYSSGTSASASTAVVPCDDCPDGQKLVLPAPPKNQ